MHLCYNISNMGAMMLKASDCDIVEEYISEPQCFLDAVLPKRKFSSQGRRRPSLLYTIHVPQNDPRRAHHKAHGHEAIRPPRKGLLPSHGIDHDSHVVTGGRAEAA